MLIRSELPAVYTLADRDKLRDGTMLGSKLTAIIANEPVKVVILQRYPNIAYTSHGCFSWTDLLLWNGKKGDKRG